MFVYPFFYIYHGESGFAVLLTLRENDSYPKDCGKDLCFVIAQQPLRNTSSRVLTSVRVWVHCILLWQNMLAACKELS